MSTPTTPPTLEELKRRFGEAGIPLTVQRRAVWDVLARRTDHPTADMVLEDVERELPELSRTTVYRSLETLVQLGLATRLAHPRSAVRYDPKTHRHHHLICDACGAVVDLESPALDRLDLPDLAPGGFELRDYSVQFAGLCESCSTS